MKTSFSRSTFADTTSAIGIENLTYQICGVALKSQATSTAFSLDAIWIDGTIVANNPLDGLDPMGLAVIAVGWTSTVGGGTGVTSGTGYYYDTSTGAYGTYSTSGGTTSSGDFYAGAGGSSGLDFSYSQSAAAFNGQSSTQGGSSGEGYGAGTSVGNNANGSTVSFNVGVATGALPVEFHKMTTDTTMCQKGTLNAGGQ